jgi:hypothetical protein
MFYDITSGSLRKTIASQLGATLLTQLADVTLVSPATNEVLMFDDPVWKNIDLFGAANTWGGAQTFSVDIAIVDGGTGASTALAAFDNLSPVITKGDIIVRDASNNVRLPVSVTDGHVLTVDAAEASGIKWAAPTGAVDSVFGLTGVVTIPALADELTPVGTDTVAIWDGAVHKEATLDDLSQGIDHDQLVNYNVSQHINWTTSGAEQINDARLSTFLGNAHTWGDDQTFTGSRVNLNGDAGTIAALVADDQSIVLGTSLDSYFYYDATRKALSLWMDDSVDAAAVIELWNLTRVGVGLDPQTHVDSALLFDETFTLTSGPAIGKIFNFEPVVTENPGSSQQGSLHVLNWEGTLSVAATHLAGVTINRMVNAEPAVTYSGTANLVDTFALFRGAPVVTSATSGVPPSGSPTMFVAEGTFVLNLASGAASAGSHFPFQDNTLLRATGAAATFTTQEYVSFESRPQVRTTGAGSPACVVTELIGFRSEPTLFGVGPSITRRVGLDIVGDVGTTVYGIRSDVSAHANRRFIRHTGTAISDFGGDINFTAGTVDFASVQAASSGNTSTGKLPATGPSGGTSSHWAEVKSGGTSYWVALWT